MVDDTDTSRVCCEVQRGVVEERDPSSCASERVEVCCLPLAVLGI